MVIILERDEAERLQYAGRAARDRVEDFSHAVHRARFCLKGDFNKVTLSELLR